MKNARFVWTLLGGLAAVVLAANVILLVLCGYYFFHGSFEAFPTPEQESKVKMVAGIILALLLASAAGLVRLLMKIVCKRGQKNIQQTEEAEKKSSRIEKRGVNK